VLLLAPLVADKAPHWIPDLLPFIQRFGRYIGVTEERLLAWAEGTFRPCGPWAITAARHTPGMRIVLSALSGILGVPYKVFIPCVLISASIWAAMFLELGRRLGRRVQDLFQLFQAHLVSRVALGLILLVIGYLGYEHGFKPKNHRKPVQEPC
jgi:membrane protein DedA with SNARE-associated domain